MGTQPRLAALSTLALLGGCGSLLNANYVGNRFEAIHGCSAERVVTTYGGYRVEGCGIRAHFACRDPDPDPVSDGYEYDDDQPLLANLMLGILHSAIDDSVERDICIHEHSERVGPSAPAPAALPRPDPIRHSKTRKGELRMSIRLPLAERGDRMIGFPTMAEPAVALRVHRGVEAGCAIGLRIDGEHLPVADSHVRRQPDDVAIALTTATLERLALARHASIELCGARFDLGAESLARLRLFASRYTAARARLPAPGAPEPSGSIRPARAGAKPLAR